MTSTLNGQKPTLHITTVQGSGGQVTCGHIQTVEGSGGQVTCGHLPFTHTNNTRERQLGYLWTPTLHIQTVQGLGGQVTCGHPPYTYKQYKGQAARLPVDTYLTHTNSTRVRQLGYLWTPTLHIQTVQGSGCHTSCSFFTVPLNLQLL